MEVIAEIRRRHLVSKESISSIARDLKLSRPTVRKHLQTESEAVYLRQHQPAPKLGDFQSVLESWLLVQHPFCKFFGCWFCAAVLAGALRACSARGAEDGTAARRNIDRPYPQAISSGHSYLYPRRNRQHGTTRRTSPSGGGFCGAAE
jgi:hypothetical protein